STWSFDDELLQLLWAVEYVANAATRGDHLLQQVLAGAIFSQDELPAPSTAEKRAPDSGRGTLLDGLMEDDGSE
ncbi:hypothetical protein, partial [Bacillus cereus group sp. BC57]|uniref:hypothetical protein n=1 Tax=Bacillus cereus group sp. BC57 TaxID=3445287 RepID=UPI003F2116AC